ncbi:hypothetical protein [uncultured Clostridium sp.]|uniref:hypothetical protein n=1 Tax=uncultured Clostridium sp. TaxID=59620 RepID=UPI0025EC7BC6|nr:hypothetical protein [uncultured Clostridium sp.]
MRKKLWEEPKVEQLNLKEIAVICTCSGWSSYQPCTQRRPSHGNRPFDPPPRHE